MVLGKPDAISREEDTGTPYWSYSTTDPVDGWLMVFMHDGILIGIRLILKTPLRKEDITRLFGPDFVVVHYDLDECLGKGGAAPTFVSLNGPIETWEYRGHGNGLVISVHNGLAEEVSFDCGPTGPPKSKCQSRSRVHNP
jgi:hypothetical protein